MPLQFVAPDHPVQTEALAALAGDLNWLVYLDSSLILYAKLVVAGTELTWTTDDGVEFLQAGDQLHDLVFAKTGKFWPEAAAHDVGGGFCYLHAKRSRCSDVTTLIVGVKS